MGLWSEPFVNLGHGGAARKCSKTGPSWNVHVDLVGRPGLAFHEVQHARKEWKSARQRAHRHHHTRGGAGLTQVVSQIHCNPSAGPIDEGAYVRLLQCRYGQRFRLSLPTIVTALCLRPSIWIDQLDALNTDPPGSVHQPHRSQGPLSSSGRQLS